MKAPVPNAEKVTAIQMPIPTKVYAVAVRDRIMLYINRGKMEIMAVKATRVLIAIHFLSHFQ